MSGNTDQSIFGDAIQRNFDEGVTKSEVKITPELFEKYEEKIFEARPDIKKFIETNGQKSFFDYTKSHIRENRNPIIKGRKEQLHNVIYEEVARLLGTKIAASVKRQLKGNDSVSTIQHSVPLGHPYVLAASFQNALPYLGANHPNLQNVLIMANSLASFNNYSLPKGDYLHTFEVELEGHQFNFFGQTSDAASTIFHEAFGETEIAEMQKRAMQLRQSGKITKEQLEKITELLDEVYASPHTLSQSTYLDQLTVLSFYLFKKMMKPYKKNVPNLIFISQELITLRLLREYHMSHETVLGKLLFDPEFHKVFLEHFDGLNGGFNSEKDTGTFLFWALPKGAKYRERLTLNNGFLESLESTYRVELSPEGIKHAIDNNELIPSTGLVFMVLSFYYGLFVGGGLAQVKNVGSLKDAYITMLEQMQEQEEQSALSDLITNNMLVSRPLVLFMEKDGLRVPLTGMDILIHGKEASIDWEKVIEATKNVTVADILKRLYPFYYLQFVKEKDEELLKITERDVEDYLGLPNTLPALFTLSKDS